MHVINLHSITRIKLHMICTALYSSMIYTVCTIVLQFSFYSFVEFLKFQIFFTSEITRWKQRIRLTITPAHHGEKAPGRFAFLADTTAKIMTKIPQSNSMAPKTMAAILWPLLNTLTMMLFLLYGVMWCDV